MRNMRASERAREGGVEREREGIRKRDRERNREIGTERETEKIGLSSVLPVTTKTKLLCSNPEQIN